MRLPLGVVTVAALVAVTACDGQARARRDLARLGVEYSHQALTVRAGEGDERAVRLLLDAGMHPNTDPDEGPTPLMQAAGGGFEDVVRLLLESQVYRRVLEQDWRGL